MRRHILFPHMLVRVLMSRMFVITEKGPLWTARRVEDFGRIAVIDRDDEAGCKRSPDLMHPIDRLKIDFDFSRPIKLNLNTFKIIEEPRCGEWTQCFDKVVVPPIDIDLLGGLLIHPKTMDRHGIN